MQHVGKFRKIEKGKNPIVTDGGAMQRRTGETFVKWAKRINLEIHEEKSALGWVGGSFDRGELACMQEQFSAFPKILLAPPSALLAS